MGTARYMMNWNPDMTREEYDLALEHLLQKDYGDGYGYILEYLDIWQESQDKNNCWDCWEYASILSDTYEHGILRGRISIARYTFSSAPPSLRRARRSRRDASF